MPTSSTGRANPGSTPCTTAAPSSSAKQRPDPARREQLGDRLRAAVAAHLFVVAEREQHAAPRNEPLADQALDGFEDADHGALVVDCAAAPDEAAVDASLEGRVRPALEILGGHDVQVGREQDRPLLRIRPRPRVEQRIARHDLPCERAMQLRVRSLDPATQGRERLGLEIRGIGRVRDGRDAERSGEPLRHFDGIDRALRSGRRVDLPRWQAQRGECKCREEERERGERGHQELAHDAHG
jgi:hypothetical protein